MQLYLGIKSDPIEYRYSFDWLFSFMQRKGLQYLQLGSFFELYHLPDGYFIELRRRAEERGVRIKSCFTSHRELGGFFSGNPDVVDVARKCYERYIEIAALLGADYMGSNPGAVFRDRMSGKQEGIDCYLRHMIELSRYARDLGLKALTMEPMSSLAEPPSTPGEITEMLETLSRAYEADSAAMVPVYLCGDISHGLVSADGQVLFDHETLFEGAIQRMAEFHFKNTDASYNSTFGFGPGERRRGIVDLQRLQELIFSNEHRWPVNDVVGYLEIGGPKLGRDFSDQLLEPLLEESIDAIQEVFGGSGTKT